MLKGSGLSSFRASDLRINEHSFHAHYATPSLGIHRVESSSKEGTATIWVFRLRPPAGSSYPVETKPSRRSYTNVEVSRFLGERLSYLHSRDLLSAKNSIPRPLVGKVESAEATHQFARSSIESLPEAALTRVVYSSQPRGMRQGDQNIS